MQAQLRRGDNVGILASSDGFSPAPNLWLAIVGGYNTTTQISFDGQVDQHFPSILSSVRTLLALSQYPIATALLFYLACRLWETKCLASRDLSAPWPLPDGNMGFPFVGELLHFLFLGASYQRKRRRQYGDIYRTHMFGRPSVIVIGSENVRPILLGEGHLVEAVWPSTTRRILGTHGIVNGDRETHVKIKRLALRAFSPKYISRYTPVMKERIMSHIQEWQTRESVALFEACTQMVSKTMMTVLLGILPDDPYIQRYIEAEDDIVNSILSLPVNLPGFKFRKGLMAQKYIFDKIESELRRKLHSSDEELFRSTEGEERFESVLVNILKLARLEQVEVTLKNLQNLSLEFIFAGSQSLRCSSSSLVLHICKHPEVVERLRKEIRSSGLWDVPLKDVGHREIEALPFLRNVVYETLRVTPTIPGAVRVALKTFELGGYQIPKGWQVVYSIRYTHEKAAGKILHDGTRSEFDPDEYFGKLAADKSKTGSDEPIAKSADSISSSSSAYGFIPFGKGARMCAGKNYGLLFLRVFLFQLVRTVDVSLVGSCARMETCPMMRPHKSVKIRVQPTAKLKST